MHRLGNSVVVGAGNKINPKPFVMGDFSNRCHASCCQFESVTQSNRQTEEQQKQTRRCLVGTGKETQSPRDDEKRRNR